MSIFRQYTYDDSFEQVFVSSKFLKEYQIALTYANDYDDHDSPTNGIFRPTWDPTKATPATIDLFKKKNPDVKVKVYISIGNRGTRFPFSPSDNDTWIANATQSLTDIIKNNKQANGNGNGNGSNNNNLQVDGIDVSYEHIEASPDDFAECVGKLLKNLKESGVIREASVSPSFALNGEFYSCLYGRWASLIDWVDYQFQNEVTPVFNPDTLVERFQKLALEFYPRRKLIAGYSAENEDWATLSPIVFFLGGMDILKKRRGTALGAGISIHYHNYYHDHDANSTHKE